MLEMLSRINTVFVKRVCTIKQIITILDHFKPQKKFLGKNFFFYEIFFEWKHLFGENMFCDERVFWWKHFFCENIFLCENFKKYLFNENIFLVKTCFVVKACFDENIIFVKAYFLRKLVIWKIRFPGHGGYLSTRRLCLRVDIGLGAIPKSHPSLGNVFS